MSTDLDAGPDRNFAQLIRLSKWWKRTVANGDTDFRFKSFMIELIWANLAACATQKSERD